MEGIFRRPIITSAVVAMAALVATYLHLVPLDHPVQALVGFILMCSLLLGVIWKASICVANVDFKLGKSSLIEYKVQQRNVRMVYLQIVFVTLVITTGIFKCI